MLSRSCTRQGTIRSWSLGWISMRLRISLPSVIANTLLYAENRLNIKHTDSDCFNIHFGFKSECWKMKSLLWNVQLKCLIMLDIQNKAHIWIQLSMILILTYWWVNYFKSKYLISWLFVSVGFLWMGIIQSDDKDNALWICASCCLKRRSKTQHKNRLNRFVEKLMKSDQNNIFRPMNFSVHVKLQRSENNPDIFWYENRSVTEVCMRTSCKLELL